MPLNPEAGGTERITSLIAQGLRSQGFKCMGILEFKEGSNEMIYDGEKIVDLYAFLKEYMVDVVINQIAYDTWLLRTFLDHGGELWHVEGGKIISCLHFDPKNPSYLQLLRSCEHLTIQQYISYLKYCLLKPYFTKRQKNREGEIYNFVYENSDAMVTLSASHFQYLREVMHRAEFSKLYAIGNPLTFPHIADISILEHKAKTILVCARMSEYHKRITLTLKAWQLVKKYQISMGWRLIVVGDGPDLPRYKRFVETENIKDIEFKGQQSPLPYYEKASILLLTSSAEGWGLTLTEALQNGVVPVVMDSSSVYRDIIQSHYNGTLTPNNDIKTFAKAILTLMKDKKSLREMQKNALISASEFTLDKAIDKWTNLLTAV